MLKLTIDGKELKVKYGFEATLKTRVLSKMVAFEQMADTDNMERIEDMLLFLPELLLVGLQKYHKDEYGFDFENEDGKDEQLSKAFELVEGYCDIEGNDAVKLYQELENEMMTDGFLAGMFQKEQAKAKTRAAKAKTEN